MLKFVKPETKYIQSYWETFDTVAKEKIYLASTEAFPLESTIEYVKSSIEKGVPQLFVIDTEKDRCVGWCDASPKEDTVGYIGTGLLKKYRGKGIGSQLLCQIIELSKQYGYHKLELDVRASNKCAIHVYEKAGFKIYNTVKDGFIFCDNVVSEDVVQMELTPLV